MHSVYCSYQIWPTKNLAPIVYVKKQKWWPREQLKLLKHLDNRNKKEQCQTSLCLVVFSFFAMYHLTKD